LSGFLAFAEDTGSASLAWPTLLAEGCQQPWRKPGVEPR